MLLVGASLSCACPSPRKNVDGEVRRSVPSSLPSASATSMLAAALVPDAGPGKILHITGANPTCALYDSGNVRCWGSVSRVGGVSASVSGCSGTPVDLGRIEGAVRIEVLDRLCAVTASGDVACFAQRSNGTDRTPRVAAKIAGVSATEDLLLDSYFACVRTKTGTVRCWPWHRYGGNEAAAAEELAGLSGALQIAIGESTFSDFVCARLPGGKVVCARLEAYEGAPVRWGRPREVPELAGATDLVAEGFELCARTPTGGRCYRVDWDTGPPGAPPAPKNAFELPLLLTRLRMQPWIHDEKSGCRLLADGTVSCTFDRGVPFVVPSLTDAREITGDSWHACALRADGRVVCWGPNTSYGAGGYIGQRVTIQPNRSSATEVVDLTDAVDLAAGTLTSCARRRDGGVVCWGDVPGHGEHATPTPLPSLEPAVAIAVGDGYVCAAMRDGKLACTHDANKEPPVPRPVVSLGGGSSDVLVGLDDGALYTARMGIEPRAGLTVFTKHLAPTPIARAESFASIVAAGRAGQAACTCAIASSPGPVLCWGPNPHGECGAHAGERKTPGPVAEIGDAVQVVGGAGFGCVRRASGRVTCWRASMDGTDPAFFEPFDVGDAVDLTAGPTAVCARRASGTYACSDNARGELSYLGHDLELQGVLPLLSGTRKLALGLLHGCALRSDGHVLCFDAHMKPSLLGDGSVLGSDVPMVVEGL